MPCSDTIQSHNRQVKLRIGMKKTVQRLTLLGIGWLSLIAGLIGILLPVLPTTPFLLLSAWCFSRSSGRLHQWLLNQRHFGQVIRRWEEDGSMERRIKFRAIAMIIVGFSLTLLIAPIGQYLQITLVLLATAISAYVYRLPEPLGQTASAQKQGDHD